MSIYDDMRGLLAGLVTSDEWAEKMDWAVETAEAGHDEAVMQCEHLERALSRMQDERDAALEALEGRVELPVGADGHPIHVGDVVDVLPADGHAGHTGVRVLNLTLRGSGWLVSTEIPGHGVRGYYPARITSHEREDFGERLRRLLRERGMSQSDLARATDTSVATVSRWCTHERTPRYAQLVAVREALGCSWDDLMGA